MYHRQLFRHLLGNPNCASLGQQQMLSNPGQNASWGSSESLRLCSGQGPRPGTGLWEPSLSPLWMLYGMPRPRMQGLPGHSTPKRELDRFLVIIQQERTCPHAAPPAGPVTAHLPCFSFLICPKGRQWPQGRREGSAVTQRHLLSGRDPGETQGPPPDRTSTNIPISFLGIYKAFTLIRLPRLLSR